MNQRTAPQFPKAPLEGQIISTHQDFTLEVCLDESSKHLAYKIRYESYLEAGMTEPSLEGLLYDEYDFMPNVRIFLVWFQDQPVATVRSCIYSEAYNWLATEGVKHFRQELQEKTGSQSRILESNRFAVDPNFQGRQSLFARFLLFRAHGLNAAVHQCSYIITSVQSNHVAFYRRFLNLNPISDQPHFYDWLGADVSLLINETEACLGAILKRGMPGYDEEDIRHFAMCTYVPLIDQRKDVA